MCVGGALCIFNHFSQRPPLPLPCMPLELVQTTYDVFLCLLPLSWDDCFNRKCGPVITNRIQLATSKSNHSVVSPHGGWKQILLITCRHRITVVELYIYIYIYAIRCNMKHWIVLHTITFKLRGIYCHISLLSWLHGLGTLHMLIKFPV